MPTPPNNEQFVGISAAQDLNEKASRLTNDKRQIYTYSDLLSGSTGATTLETGTSLQSAGIQKLAGVYTVGGVQYDSYNLKCWAPLRPENTAHVIPIGSIEVGAGNIFFINNRSNVEAVDFNGFGGYTNSPINVGAMVDDLSDVARPISSAGLFYINQENIPTFPVTFNAMYIVAADTLPFECDAYVDVDFICQQGTSVEFTIL
ncbi:MAG: hypothetical protein MK212_20160 [Saprospiraceae bacterium]|nr:hypothetical protein [Saprospiraceae bacterium]